MPALKYQRRISGSKVGEIESATGLAIRQAMMKLVRDGMTVKEIAVQYNVTPSMVYAWLSGKKGGK